MATFCVLVLLGLARPGVVRAQDLSGADAPIPRSPLEQLIEQKAALALTPDQLSRLDEIRAQLTATNEPLVTRMMTLRTQWQRARRASNSGRGGAEMAERLERIRTNADRVRDRIQRNNRTAMQSVSRLLTPDQRAQLRTLLQERRESRAGARGGGETDGDERR